MKTTREQREDWRKVIMSNYENDMGVPGPAGVVRVQASILKLLFDDADLAEDIIAVLRDARLRQSDIGDLWRTLPPAVMADIVP